MSDTTNSQGAEPTDLSEGQGTGGAPKAPVDNGNNKPAPAEDGTDVTLKNDPSPKKDEKKADPEPKKDPAEDTSNKDDVDAGDPRAQYIEFEDAAGQSVVELLKEANVKAIEANAMFQEAIETGDLSKVRWDLLEARLGKAKATLARAGIEQHYNQSYKRNEETRNFAYEAVGGEQNWDKVTKWARGKEKNDPAFKSELDNLRSAIDLGGYSAQAAVGRLKSLYEGDTSNSGLNAGKQLQRGDRQGSPVGEPLSRADYMKAMHKAQATNNRAEIEQLRARRQAGLKAGL